MTVQVIHGANVEKFEAEGRKVSEVARNLQDVFNIPKDYIALIDGIKVDDNYVLKDGDTLEFFKPYGRKGGVQDYWSETEIAVLLGADAVSEMQAMGFTSSHHPVYTSDQITAWQAARTEKPALPKHGLVVDPGTFTVSYLDHDPVDLGNTILFKLISRLAKRPNVFVDFNRLKWDVWGDDHTSDEAVSKNVSRLRGKLKTLGITLEQQKHAVRLKLN